MARTMLPVNVSNTVHRVMAVVLFVSFAVMILTQFTKGNDMTRNRIYYICGTIIIAFMLNQVCAHVFRYPGYWTLINEFVML